MVQWSGGGIKGMIRTFEALPGEIRNEAHTLLQETVAAAAANQRQLIEMAKTPTGEKREAEGKGVAGRVDTGLMINSITASATEDTTVGLTQDDGGTITGTWGWQDPEDYFTYQDQGTDRIAPALSLLTSYLVAKTQFERDLNDVVAKVVPK